MDPCGQLAPNYLGNLPLPCSYLFPASWLAQDEELFELNHLIYNMWYLYTYTFDKIYIFNLECSM